MANARYDLFHITRVGRPIMSEIQCEGRMSGQIYMKIHMDMFIFHTIKTEREYGRGR